MLLQRDLLIAIKFINFLVGVFNSGLNFLQTLLLLLHFFYKLLDLHLFGRLFYGNLWAAVFLISCMTNREERTNFFNMMLWGTRKWQFSRLILFLLPKKGRTKCGRVDWIFIFERRYIFLQLNPVQHLLNTTFRTIFFLFSEVWVCRVWISTLALISPCVFLLFFFNDAILSFFFLQFFFLENKAGDTFYCLQRILVVLFEATVLFHFFRSFPGLFRAQWRQIRRSFGWRHILLLFSHDLFLGIINYSAIFCDWVSLLQSTRIWLVVAIEWTSCAGFGRRDVRGCSKEILPIFDWSHHSGRNVWSCSSIEIDMMDGWFVKGSILIHLDICFARSQTWSSPLKNDIISRIYLSCGSVWQHWYHIFLAFSTINIFFIFSLYPQGTSCTDRVWSNILHGSRANNSVFIVDERDLGRVFAAIGWSSTHIGRVV